MFNCEADPLKGPRGSIWKVHERLYFKKILVTTQNRLKFYNTNVGKRHPEVFVEVRGDLIGLWGLVGRFLTASAAI